eukprot:UN00906
MLRCFKIDMSGTLDLITYTNMGLKQSVTKCFENVNSTPKYKRIVMSNWNRSILGNDQIMYACLDALYGERIAVKLAQTTQLESCFDNTST